MSGDESPLDTDSHSPPDTFRRRTNQEIGESVVFAAIRKHQLDAHEKELQQQQQLHHQQLLLQQQQEQLQQLEEEQRQQQLQAPRESPGSSPPELSPPQSLPPVSTTDSGTTMVLDATTTLSLGQPVFVIQEHTHKMLHEEVDDVMDDVVEGVAEDEEVRSSE